MLNWIKNKIFNRALTYETANLAGLIARESYAGIPVTELNALGLPAVWAAIRVISEDLATLPCELHSVDEDGHTLDADEHPLSNLLEREPNPEMNPVDFFQLLVKDAILGNGYCEIERDGAGRPIALWPIPSKHVRVMRDGATGMLSYAIQRGGYSGPPGPAGTIILQAQDVIHIHGLSPDGSIGYTLLNIAGNTFSWGLGAERYGGSLWKNQGYMSGVVKETMAGMGKSKEGRENFLKSIKKDTAEENAGNLLYLRYGLAFDKIDPSNNAQLQYSQLLDWFNTQVCRLFRISPTKIFDFNRATWSNLTEVNRAHWSEAIRPWAIKIEQELERKCLLPKEKGKYQIRFDTTPILRSDQSSRFTCYSQALANQPWLTVNEVRAMEGGYPATEDGDEIRLPPAPPAPAPPAPAPPPEQDQQDDNQGADDKGANDE